MHAAFARDNENRCKVFRCLLVLRNEKSVQTVFSCRGTVGVDVTFISAAFLDVHGREPGKFDSHWLGGQRGGEGGKIVMTRSLGFCLCK